MFSLAALLHPAFGRRAPQPPPEIDQTASKNGAGLNCDDVS
jgi:hypothetical protein